MTHGKKTWGKSLRFPKTWIIPHSKQKRLWVIFSWHAPFSHLLKTHCACRLILVLRDCFVVSWKLNLGVLKSLNQVETPKCHVYSSLSSTNEWLMIPFLLHHIQSLCVSILSNVFPHPFKTWFTSLPYSMLLSCLHYTIIPILPDFLHSHVLYITCESIVHT